MATPNHTVNNQAPATLDPVHVLPVSGDYDPTPAVRSTLTDPMFASIGNQPVSITDNAGGDVDSDAVTDLWLRIVGETVDTDADEQLKDLLSKTLLDYDKADPVLANEVFAVQAREQNNRRGQMPPPSARVLYTASDVSHPAKQMLSGADDSAFFAGLAYKYSPETLGFWFQTADAFDEFTQWFSQQVQPLLPMMSGKTTSMITQFTSLSLKGLTESLILRNADDQENEEFSFARVLIHMLMRYQHEQGRSAVANQKITQATTGVLPFTLPELFLPRTIVLVNVELHARASDKKIENEWTLINRSLRSKIKVFSNNQLSKLTALPRLRAKAAAAAANAQSNRRAASGRAAKIVFRKRRVTPAAIIAGIIRVLSRMKKVNQSQNVYKTQKISFGRPNRRDPMDPNRPGRVVSKHFLPDIHIFLDCSGSISEENYQDGIQNLIALAKKLNVNLYFNSFSHMLSQPVLLKTQNKSTKQIWNEFKNIPKVSGGTDYQQIFDYIQASKKRRERLSIILSDYGWAPSSQRTEHPKNLYYAPISVSDAEWPELRRSAERFARSMRHIEPHIHQRMIGMIR